MLVLAQVIMGAQAEVDDSGARPAQSP
jgi:hypothetical protein